MDAYFFYSSPRPYFPLFPATMLSVNYYCYRQGLLLKFIDVTYCSEYIERIVCFLLEANFK